jgi:hypothetical protein
MNLLFQPGEKVLSMADQGYDRLGQLLALLSKNLHSYDVQHHANVFANGLPETKKIKRSKSCFYNAGLDEWESSEKKGEAIWLASIFGGTSID